MTTGTTLMTTHATAAASPVAFDADTIDALGGPDWLAARRRAALTAAIDVGLPSTDEEIWRYSPIGDLDLSVWSAPVPRPADTPAPVPTALSSLLEELGERAATLVVRNGTVVLADVEPRWADAGLEVGRLATLADGEALLGHVAGAPADVFGHLNDALVAEPLVVRVPAGLAVGPPVVVLEWVDADAVIVPSRLVVVTGEDAEVTVVEWQGGDDVTGLALPVTELAAGNASRLRHLVVQDRGRRMWQIASLHATAGRDATVVSGHAALGGHYARTRTDCRLEGRGAHGELTAAYLADGDQTLDFRTQQRHDSPDTTSDLLFCGVVDDQSRSIYTGTIVIAPGARGSDANQTNRNLKLGEKAWAESVPNLEIENNDVRCSHASTVGPVDADQLFYLESRGVPTAEAERLIVAGFFDDPVRRLPVPSVTDLVRNRIAARLGTTHVGVPARAGTDVDGEAAR
jgi:Fe-S cluster assembly protein SufD